jgi:hypothetical protein
MHGSILRQTMLYQSSCSRSRLTDCAIMGRSESREVCLAIVSLLNRSNRLVEYDALREQSRPFVSNGLSVKCKFSEKTAEN